MPFTVVVSHVNSGKSKNSHHKRRRAIFGPGGENRGMRPWRLMIIALIPPTIMKGWDELEDGGA